jgi:hypothetical protein
MNRRNVFKALAAAIGAFFVPSFVSTGNSLSLDHGTTDLFSGKDDQYPWMFANHRPVDARETTYVYNKYGHRCGSVLGSTYQTKTGRFRYTVIAQASPFLMKREDEVSRVLWRDKDSTIEEKRLALDKRYGADRPVIYLQT